MKNRLVKISVPLIFFSMMIPLAAGVIDKNYSNSLALLDTAEGYLTSCRKNISRIRELAVQAANGIYGNKDRAIRGRKVQTLLEDARRQLQFGLFNGMALFRKGRSREHDINTVYFKTGPYSGFSFAFPQKQDIFDDTVLHITTPRAAEKGIRVVDGLLCRINSALSDIGGVRERLRHELVFQRALSGAIVNGVQKDLKTVYILSKKTIFARMWTLAMQSANGIYSAIDRRMIDASFQQLKLASSAIDTALTAYQKNNRKGGMKILLQPALPRMDVKTIDNANVAIGICSKLLGQ